MNSACAGLQILVPDVGPEMVLSIKVMDYDIIGKDELMGEYEIVLDKDNEEAAFLRDSSEAFPLNAALIPGRKKGTARKAGKPRGDLKMTLQYTPFFNAAAEAAAVGENGEQDPAKAMEAAAVRNLSEMSHCYSLLDRCSRIQRSSEPPWHSACILLCFGNVARPCALSGPVAMCFCASGAPVRCDLFLGVRLPLVSDSVWCMQRARAARPISDTTKGVLTVDLSRCTDLPSSKGGCNSYVQVGSSPLCVSPRPPSPL